MNEKICVSKEALRQVLDAFQGPSHHIMELWAINAPYIDNPVTKLINKFNAAPAQEGIGTVTREPEPMSWEDAQRIADLDSVCEAFCALAADPTGDNGVEAVRAVMEAIRISWAFK